MKIDRQAARVAWLRAHPDAWKDAPSLTDAVTDEGRGIIMTLVQTFRQLNLLPKTTAIYLAKDSVRRAVGLARR
jgi:hypothetical protein